MKVEISFIDVKESIVFSREFKKFIEHFIELENRKLGEIHFIFTSNRYILEINRSFLNHHYYTDVITFADNKKSTLSGEIYISIDQVVINAKTYSVALLDEIGRVIIHGVLHLIGYKDKTENEKIVMRQKEDVYLRRFKEYDLIAECEI